MSRPLRLHFENGFYYVVQRSNGYHPLFSTETDYASFEAILSRTLIRWSAQIHAFCWLPSEIHLLLQVAHEPVGRLMQQLSSRYACLINRRGGIHGCLFRDRYQALLIDPDRYLLPTVRYIHEAPLRVGVVAELNAFRMSSHVAYTENVTIPWLTTKVVFRMLLRSELAAPKGYSEYMQSSPEMREDFLTRKDKRHDSRVIADPAFVARIPRSAQAYRTTTSLDRLIDSVALTLGMDREDILSRSSGRQAALARAVVAWHAMERGVATLAEVARRFDRGPSSLSESIGRLRKQRPELFHVGGLRDAAPLLPGLMPLESRTIGESRDAAGESANRRSKAHLNKSRAPR